MKMNIDMKNITKSICVLLIMVLITAGCNDFLEPSVDQNRPTDTSVESVDDLESVVLGIHDYLNATNLFGRNFVVSPEARADNGFSNQNSGRFITQSRNNFTVNSAYANGLWSTFYQAIAAANIAINADLDSTPAVDYAKGQAYALRAFSHMNLLLAFGQQFSGGTAGIPYIITYNDGNLYPARESASEIWSRIGADLEVAVDLMDPALDAGDPAFMNYWAVRGIQSRYYLYTGEFAEAIGAADDVINNSGYSLVAAGSLADAWAAGTGPSSLFELAFTSTNNLGSNNLARIYRDTNYGDVEATQDLYDAYASDDARLGLISVQGDTIRMTGKYVNELGYDNIRVIRYAEVMLNKAEALARRNSGTDRAEALTIINNISQTRGSSRVYTAGTPTNVLAERRLELAMEGHRLYDLGRHGLSIPFVSVPSRGVNFITNADIPFGSYRYALPIPQAEMDANSNMTQNTGYE